MNENQLSEMKSEFDAALAVDPPEESAERVWKQVSQKVDAIGGETSAAIAGGQVPGGADAGGTPDRSKLTVIVAVAAALILLLGLAVVALLGSESAPVAPQNLEIVRLADAEKILDEADKAAGQGEFGTADELVDAYSAEIEKVEAAAEGDEEVEKALDEALPRHEDKLKEVEAKVPEVARKRGIARAREVHARNAARKAARAQGKGAEKDDEGDSGKAPGKADPHGKARDASKNKDGKGSGNGSGNGGSGDSGSGSGTFNPSP